MIGKKYEKKNIIIDLKGNALFLKSIIKTIEKLYERCWISFSDESIINILEENLYDYVRENKTEYEIYINELIGLTGDEDNIITTTSNIITICNAKILIKNSDTNSDGVYETEKVNLNILEQIENVLQFNNCDFYFVDFYNLNLKINLNKTWFSGINSFFFLLSDKMIYKDYFSDSDIVFLHLSNEFYFDLKKQIQIENYYICKNCLTKLDIVLPDLNNFNEVDMENFEQCQWLENFNKLFPKIFIYSKEYEDYTTKVLNYTNKEIIERNYLDKEKKEKLKDVYNNFIELIENFDIDSFSILNNTKYETFGKFFISFLNYKFVYSYNKKEVFDINGILNPIKALRLKKNKKTAIVLSASNNTLLKLKSYLSLYIDNKYKMEINGDIMFIYKNKIEYKNAVKYIRNIQYLKDV